MTLQIILEYSCDFLADIQWKHADAGRDMSKTRSRNRESESDEARGKSEKKGKW